MGIGRACELLMVRVDECSWQFLVSVSCSENHAVITALTDSLATLKNNTYFLDINKSALISPGIVNISGDFRNLEIG
jgi:hypothetical protein